MFTTFIWTYSHSYTIALQSKLTYKHSVSSGVSKGGPKEEKQTYANTVVLTNVSHVAGMLQENMK